MTELGQLWREDYSREWFCRVEPSIKTNISEININHQSCPKVRMAGLLYHHLSQLLNLGMFWELCDFEQVSSLHQQEDLKLTSAGGFC